MTTQAQNSLANACSAYLRTAMHQPIQWHEWGLEAFSIAQREQKPVLLDIGAVWCHWCHVMDRECYENAEIAEILNQNFVAVKVDRDERPDIDSRYQAAVSAMTGQGGWPLTAFLTPEGKPFFGGTYFPPDDAYGRPGFKRVLLAIAEAFREKHGEVSEQANMVLNAIGQAESFAGRSGEVRPQIIDALTSSAVSMFDAQNGGFGNQPKFPHPAALDLLLHRYARTGDAELHAVVVTTLEKMARGGVYDQLAGGFHRYSVDERWVVPHFEKMVYDNSELLKNYVHAYQTTGNSFFAEVARDIMRWVDGWLSNRQHGGFYASQDADFSLEDDGDYFTWTVDEAKAVLTEDEFQAASLHYDIHEVGEMHHNPAKNVLYQRAPLAEIGVRLGSKAERIATLLHSAKEKMYAARLQRPTPYVDQTIYTGWTALMVSAYLEAAKVLPLEEARHFALRSLDRLLSEGWDAARGLKHVIAYSDPNAAHRQVPGMLDDYAYTTLACLDGYEATSDITYFHFAERIAAKMIEDFGDEASGGFFDTPRQSQETLGALSTRRKPFQDAPTPAGNSAAAIALCRLHAYTNDPKYLDLAQQTLEVFAGVAGQFGIFAGTYGLAAIWFSQPHTEVVVVGEGPDADRLYAAAAAPFALNKAVVRYSPNQAVAANLPPALASTIPNLPGIDANVPIAIVCSNFTCRPPVRDADQLAQLLNQVLRGSWGTSFFATRLCPGHPKNRH